MRLFHRKSRADPKNSLAGDSYRYYVGYTESGKLVTERSAMQITAVYACVRVLSEAVASLPLHFYHYRDDGSKEKALNHSLYFLMHDEPNPEMTSFIFRETMMTHLLLWGNFYCQILRNGRGEVIALYPLMPNRMVVDRDEKGRIYYEYTHSSDEAGTMKNETVKLTPYEVMHIPGLGFDGLIGYSPIAVCKSSLGTSMATDEYASKFFSNGAAPSAVLEHPGIVKDPEKLRESWNQTFGGSRNAGKVAVLEEGMKYEPISINPQDSQFLETRKFQVDEIARIFRVPPHMIGDLEHATFSNVEELGLEFVMYALQPWMVRIETSLNKALLSDKEKGHYFFKLNADGLLRGNYQSRMQGYATGINNGFMCVNDVRALENLDLISDEAGGNTFMVNGTMQKLSQVGAAYESGSAEEQQEGEGDDREDRDSGDAGTDSRRGDRAGSGTSQGGKGHKGRKPDSYNTG